jgi:Geranylgeranyl pyrophosphate synthase
VLFEAALHVGALAAGASPDAAKHLAKFGTSYGCAFQIIDDYLDYAGSEDVIGKRPGDDFREGKLTLPAILAMTDHQDGLLPLFEQDDREASFDDAKKLIISSGALDGTKQQAMNFAHDAQAILADHDAPVANMLYDLAEEALARAF